MRTKSRFVARSAILRAGLVSTATLVLAACSSDANRLSLFGVDSQPPSQTYAVQPVAQPQVAPVVQPQYFGPTVMPAPAPYTAPNYTAPGYPQTTASVQTAPVQIARPQPIPQTIPQAAPRAVYQQPVYTQPRPPVAARNPQGVPIPSATVGNAGFQQARINQGFVQAQQVGSPTPLPQTYAAAAPITTSTLAPQPVALPQPVSLPAQPRQTAPVTTGSSRGGWSPVGGTRVQVQPGDTLYSMSRRYGIPVQVLQDTNGLSSPNGLRSGQTLVIPVYSTASAAPVQADTTITGTSASKASRRWSVRAPTPRPNFVRQPVAALPAQPVARAPQVTASVPTVADQGTHTVGSGDTAFNIARRYGMTVEQLAQLNGLRDSSAIRIGQRLRVSGRAPAPVQQVASVQPIPTVQQRPTAPAPTTIAARSYTPPQPAVEPQVQRQQLAASAAPRPQAVEQASTAPLQFRWPIRGRVVSNYGTLSNGVRNDGINISVPEGASIRAAEDGEVVYAGNELRGFGNLVLIQHRGGYVTAYAHNSRITVQRGDRVSRGEIVARAGSTGDVDAPQLHFEIRQGTTPVDPRPYLPQG